MNRFPFVIIGAFVGLFLSACKLLSDTHHARNGILKEIVIGPAVDVPGVMISSVTAAPAAAKHVVFAAFTMRMDRFGFGDEAPLGFT